MLQRRRITAGLVDIGKIEPIFINIRSEMSGRSRVATDWMVTGDGEVLNFGK